MAGPSVGYLSFCFTYYCFKVPFCSGNGFALEQATSYYMNQWWPRFTAAYIRHRNKMSEQTPIMYSEILIAYIIQSSYFLTKRASMLCIVFKLVEKQVDFRDVNCFVSSTIISSRIEAWTKRLVFCRWYFEMHSLKLNCCILIQILLIFLLNGPNEYMSQLVQAMACHIISDKPLSVSVRTSAHVTIPRWFNQSHFRPYISWSHIPTHYRFKPLKGDFTYGHVMEVLICGDVTIVAFFINLIEVFVHIITIHIRMKIDSLTQVFCCRGIFPESPGYHQICVI